MELDELRGKIDRIDAEIVRLLNERYRTVIEIGKWKKEKSSAVYVPAREKAVFDRLCAQNPGPVSDAALRAIYCEIMSAALSLEAPLRVAFAGPMPSFTYDAALAKFGRNVEYVVKPDSEAVFADVAAGRAGYGCVPVETSAGVVSPALDLLAAFEDVMICAECYLAAAGCGRTRFLILAKAGVFSCATGCDKTSLYFTLRDSAVQPCDCLTPFKAEGISLTLTELNGNRGFIDLEGNCEDEPVKRALAALRPLTAELRILGSYPRGISA